jgi:hypothetical protein
MKKVQTPRSILIKLRNPMLENIFKRYIKRKTRLLLVIPRGKETMG